MSDVNQDLRQQENQPRAQILDNLPRDISTICHNYYRIGKLLYDQGALARAKDQFLKSQELLVINESTISLAFKINAFLVRISLENMLNRETSDYMDQCFKLIKEMETLSHLSNNAEHFYNQALAKNYQGDLLAANTLFLKAKDRALVEKDFGLVGKCFYALATNYNYQREYSKCLELLTNMENLTFPLKNYLKVVKHLLGSNVYCEIGELKNAKKEISKAKLALRNRPCWNLFPYILLAEGKINKKLGNFTRSAQFYHLALDFSNPNSWKRLHYLVQQELNELEAKSVDLEVNFTKRIITERNLGKIDFKHRFILLEILYLLARNPGRNYDKEELVSYIWKEEYNPLIHDKLIYTSVSRLRKLLGPTNDSPKYIIRAKNGYHFNPEKHVRIVNESGNHSHSNLAYLDPCAPI